MSHFVTLVLLPPDTESKYVEYAVLEKMDPYDEALEVDEYETECACVGLQALRDANVELGNYYDMDEVRNKYNSTPIEKRTTELWAEMMAPVFAKRDEILAEHPLKDKPDPDCSKCSGMGVYLSRCNPEGKWDWWVIGGRWDGWIFGPEQEKASRGKDGGFNYGDEHHTPENNSRRVSDIPIDDPHYIPFAIITPEAEWVEQGKMGWWGNVSDPKDGEEWHEIVKRVLSKFPNHLAVAVDCHV